MDEPEWPNGIKPFADQRQVAREFLAKPTGDMLWNWCPGHGKTLPATVVACNTWARDSKGKADSDQKAFVVVVTASTPLLEQFRDDVKTYYPDVPTCVVSGNKRDIDPGIVIVRYDLAGRVAQALHERGQRAALVVYDECHHYHPAGATWWEMCKRLDARADRRLFMSATPKPWQREPGNGMSRHVVTHKTSVDAGRSKPLKIRMCVGVRKNASDANKTESCCNELMETLVMEPKVRNAIVFCRAVDPDKRGSGATTCAADVKGWGKGLFSAFERRKGRLANGIDKLRVFVVYGEKTPGDVGFEIGRDGAVARKLQSRWRDFRKRERGVIKVLLNCNMAREGINTPCDLVMHADPTQSPILIIQRIRCRICKYDLEAAYRRIRGSGDKTHRCSDPDRCGCPDEAIVLVHVSCELEDYVQQDTVTGRTTFLAERLYQSKQLKAVLDMAELAHGTPISLVVNRERQEPLPNGSADDGAVAAALNATESGGVTDDAAAGSDVGATEPGGVSDDAATEPCGVSDDVVPCDALAGPGAALASCNDALAGSDDAGSRDDADGSTNAGSCNDATGSDDAAPGTARRDVAPRGSRPSKAPRYGVQGMRIEFELELGDLPGETEGHSIGQRIRAVTLKATTRGASFLTFEAAHELVKDRRTAHVADKTEPTITCFQTWGKSFIKTYNSQLKPGEPKLPTKPDKKYKGKGWFGWGHFCGGPRSLKCPVAYVQATVDGPPPPAADVTAELKDMVAIGAAYRAKKLKRIPRWCGKKDALKFVTERYTTKRAAMTKKKAEADEKRRKRKAAKQVSSSSRKRKRKPEAPTFRPGEIKRRALAKVRTYLAAFRKRCVAPNRPKRARVAQGRRAEPRRPSSSGETSAAVRVSRDEIGTDQSRARGTCDERRIGDSRACGVDDDDDDEEATAVVRPSHSRRRIDTDSESNSETDSDFDEFIPTLLRPLSGS